MNNVLSNAFKFSSLTEKAVVEFGVLKINNDEVGKLTYFVRDNGAGFDMRHIKKLFGPFDRLHSNKEFPGMGIGLATVKKIISRHNGKIWAEAERNKGAIFYIQL
jgi:light-regulated signal transduction histidine kinase (bacteriophytochrome)